MSHVDDRVRVLVVGAGLAELRCAELLQRSGVTTELHEASERLEGRCLSAHGLALDLRRTEVVEHPRR
jgi:monoamine oxidase